MRTLLLTLMLILFSPWCHAKDESCPFNLQLKDKNGNKSCLSNYSISKTIIAEKNSTVSEMAKQYSCYSLAISTNEECSAVGFSVKFPTHCDQSIAENLRDEDAYASCKKSGCDCKVVISNGRIIQENLLSASQTLATTNNQNEVKKNPNIENKSVVNEDNSSAKKDTAQTIKIEQAANIKKESAQAKVEPKTTISATNNKDTEITTKTLFISATATNPDEDGVFNINIQLDPKTASLKINDQSIQLKSDGKYSIPNFARIGQNNVFKIIAEDVKGRAETKLISVNRKATESKKVVENLNPTKIKKQASNDAVAIIIGIASYKSLPQAEFANEDAQLFYDYAVRALGVKPENIKLLVDADAEQTEIYRTFKSWLPSRVKASTDIYVYYSGHGLPSEDGKQLYLLPTRAERDFLNETAVSQDKIVASIKATNPKSVTFFLDSCYSGLTRTGDALLASARPISLKANESIFPSNFTVITASQSDQISSSSPELKHGIFSYYLMRGMEGDADMNKDGKITAGEMHEYLAMQVPKQAEMLNRTQLPQITGDKNRVLVGK